MVTETGRDMLNMENTADQSGNQFGATADEAIHQDLSNQHLQTEYTPFTEEEGFYKGWWKEIKNEEGGWS